MTITYPLTLPSGLQFAARNWRSQDVTQDVASPFTGQSDVYAYEDGKWFAPTMTLVAMNRAQAQRWEAFLLSLKGHAGTFLLGDPLRPQPLGQARMTPGTVPLVKGSGQSGSTLEIDGAPASVPGYLLAGDLLQITCAGIARLHTILQDVNTNASGEATLDIWPNLRAAPVDNSAVVLFNARGTFHRTSPVTDWQAGSDRITKSRSFDCKERLT